MLSLVKKTVNFDIFIYEVLYIKPLNKIFIFDLMKKTISD